LGTLQELLSLLGVVIQILCFYNCPPFLPVIPRPPRDLVFGCSLAIKHNWRIQSFEKQIQDPSEASG
jgi:hypothetical protein